MAEAAHTTITSRRGLLAAAAAIPAVAGLALSDAEPQRGELLSRVREHNRLLAYVDALPGDTSDASVAPLLRRLSTMENRCWDTVCRSREDCIAKLELFTSQLDSGDTFVEEFLSRQLKEIATALARAH